MTDVKSPRAAALELLLEILEKDGMEHTVLRRGLAAHPEYDRRDRAFVTRLVEGTVERKLELDYVLNLYSSVPVKKQKPVIRTILRMSVYQLLYMDSVPDSAVCNEAVKLAVRKGFAGLKGFVNGVLRKIASNRGQLPYPAADTPEGLSVRYSMPLWIVKEWLAREGTARTEQMLCAVLSERPLTVHVNRSRQTVQAVRESLAMQGVRAESHPYSAEALLLQGYERVEELNAFRDGWIQVQDVSSQLASSLTAEAVRRLAEPDTALIRVLDVCAAPGGKSIYVADAAKADGISVQVTARDLTAEKVALIEENRVRIGLENLCPQVHDALVREADEEECYDVVIADLPCSGLGIMGRKNDIKYRMTPQAREELADLQRRILTVAGRCVKPGGYLVYSTCTINPAENEENLRWLRQNQPYAAVDIRGWLGKIQKTGQSASAEELLRQNSLREGWLQCLPGIQDCDGFFMSVSQKGEQL